MIGAPEPLPIDGSLIDRFPGECTVEIDDVQVLKPLRLERVGLPSRIAMEHDRTCHVALFKPNGDAILDVNGRE